MLKGKTALVTGSTSGIGLGIARALAKEGANIVVNGFGEDRVIAGVEKELQALGVRTLYHGADMGKPAEIEDLIRTAERTFGRIDVLVNNAGVNVTGDFDQISDAQWDAVLDVDLKGVFVCCQEALPYLPQGGRVINVGSLSGEYGGPRTPSYAAAKAGVMALTHCLARFLGPRGITVNCLSPGVIDSELTDRSMPASLRDRMVLTLGARA
ncbi:MAG: SDR family NAD(P)-dependent oxidoreductase [Polyangiaceae bacterium]|nr:SDR family NAD(P)-dependent oxidoreductase [Polyangiaceae bacterium]